MISILEFNSKIKNQAKNKQHHILNIYINNSVRAHFKQ